MVLSSPPSRPRTPGISPPPEDAILPPIPNQQGSIRRPSFSFLRRSKSGEAVRPQRVPSGGKLTKKQAAAARDNELLLHQENSVPELAPRIPDLPSPPRLQSFGGENARQDSVSYNSQERVGYKGYYQQRASMDAAAQRAYKVPIPPIPGNHASMNVVHVDPYSRTPSMANRGRYSYASSHVSTINSPRRMRRRKDPTMFNILVIGTRGSGKTSFINFLRTSLSLQSHKQESEPHDQYMDHINHFPNFTSQYLETEIEGERIGLTLWDSQGLEASIVDLQLREVSSFVESKFEETFLEEQKVIRSPGARDTHIHCVFLLLDPIRLDANLAASQKPVVSNGNHYSRASNGLRTPAGLNEALDLQVMRNLQGKTTVVPVISKADSITTAHMAHLKRAVWSSLKASNIDTLEALGQEDDASLDDSSDENRLDERDEDAAISKVPEERKLSQTSHLESPSDTESEDFQPAKSRNTSSSGTRVPSYSNHPSVHELPASASRHTSYTNQANNNDHTTPHARSTSFTQQPSSQGPHAQFSSDQPSHNPSYSHQISAQEVPYLPLSIISPDLYEPEVIGRRFPWGFADPYNKDHCDFERLKDTVFGEWRGELREASREVWYEGWRTGRLEKGGGGRRGR